MTLKTHLQKYGRNIHSFIALETELEVWQSDTRDASVAYVDRGRHWVALGAPLSDVDERVRVSREFAKAARLAGRRAVFFGVSERYWEGVKGSAFDALKIAEQPLWNPAEWSGCLANNQRLRNRIRACQKDGVELELVSAESLTRQEVQQLKESWENSHSLPPLCFMSAIETFACCEDKLYLGARLNGRLVGLAVGVPIYGLRGWLLEDLLVERQAARGLAEALIDRFVQTAQEQGSQVISLGLVPLQGLECRTNQRHPILKNLMCLGKRVFRPLYNADGLKRFRDKFSPESWESVYLVSPDKIDFWTLRAVLMAFAGGWVPRFGWLTLKRLVSKAAAKFEAWLHRNLHPDNCRCTREAS